uniref:Ciliogenesis-associated TTC17-interacting protein n=1 Tax=Schistosoma haematobium TaxID=6185 RepID=A0A095CD64_SCHHA
MKGLLVKTSIRTMLGEIHSTTTLEANITSSLETISQTKLETIVMNGSVVERKSTIELVENVYEIGCTESVNGEIKFSTKKNLAQSNVLGLIAEGSDLIFQRILVKSAFSVPFEVIGLDTDYNLATVSYDEIKAQYLLYLRDHPEIHDMISDFIKSLLLHKPDEVVKYASEYFKSFSARALPSRIFSVKTV